MNITKMLGFMVITVMVGLIISGALVFATSIKAQINIDMLTYYTGSFYATVYKDPGGKAYYHWQMAGISGHVPDLRDIRKSVQIED